MSTDLRDDLRRLAGTWESAAPSISAEEVMSRRATTRDVADHRANSVDGIAVGATFTKGSRRRHEPRRRGVAIYGLGAATLIAGFLIIAANRTDAPTHDPTNTGPAPSTPTTGLPNPTTIDPTTINPTGTTESAVITTESAPVSTLSAATQPSPTTPSASAAGPAEVRAAAVNALTELTSFRATVTSRQYQTASDGSVLQDTTTTNTVTFMGDGRMWFEGDSFIWGSFDPATGTVRGEYADPDGSEHYQQIDGWADNTTGINIMFGYNPVPVPASFADDAVVEDVVQLDRPAWKLTMTSSILSPGATAASVETSVVDQATGLVVAHSSTNPQSDGTTFSQESEFTSLSVGVELPANFPGAFPEGATVERSGDPAAFTTLSLADAVAEFGQPVFAPADISPTSRSSIQTMPTGEQASGEPAEVRSLRIEVPVGFARSYISITDYSALADPLPTNSSVLAMSRHLDGGALAGQPYDVSGATLTIFASPLSITVDAPTAELALQLANSLVAVPSG